ncbi:hypothetical protein, partial [Hominenteromicrobium sp.]|uniref:hypothetical protein n=1 Tax=Hominenteromicrobium sp. TaxID=3073581 RepID=UPI003AF0B2D4
KKGVYSAEDVRYSRSFVTASERTQANIAVGKQRLQEMGFFGTLKQLEEKVQQIIGIVGKIADIDRMLVHQIAGVFCKEARVPTGFEINVIGNIELCGK